MIDWSKMTPREIWEAFKTAPSVIGPWDEKNVRYNLVGCEQAFRNITGRWTVDIGPGDDTNCIQVDSKEECDAALRAAGYTLVD